MSEHAFLAVRDKAISRWCISSLVVHCPAQKQYRTPKEAKVGCQTDIYAMEIGIDSDSIPR